MTCECGHAEDEHQRVGDRRECFEAISEHVLCACWDFRPEVQQIPKVWGLASAMPDWDTAKWFHDLEQPSKDR